MLFFVVMEHEIEGRRKGKTVREGAKRKLADSSGPASVILVYSYTGGMGPGMASVGSRPSESGPIRINVNSVTQVGRW